MFAEAIAPEPIEFDYVGELYGLIASGFEFLVKNHPRGEERGEGDLFIGRPEFQDADTWSANLSIFPITNLSSAKAAITFIVEQGEGTTTASDKSHFATFTTIARQLKERIDARPGFSPSRNVLKNPLTRTHRDAGPGYNLIDPASIAHPVAELFNHVYASVLLLLMTFFDPAGESAEQRGVARDTARRVMSGLLRPLAEMLTVLPATSDPNGPTGGAPFELYGTLKIPPNPGVRFAILSERFTAAAGEARRLLRLGNPLEPKCCRCHQLGYRTEPEEGKMKRILLTAIVLLAAANLPLAAQTPSGPVQGAVQGTVKGTATVGQGVECHLPGRRSPIRRV